MEPSQIHSEDDINGLVQDYGNSGVSALELPQSCTKS